METIHITGRDLTIDQVVKIARGKDVQVILSPEARERIAAARSLVDTIVKENRVVYGITTGFGFLKNVVIGPDQTVALQENLIRSHSVGVGPVFSEEVVRGAIAVRVNSLAAGFSGVRFEVLEMLLALLNQRIYPYVPQQGSVGASGDLAPLAHLMLVLMGEGECWRNGVRVPSADELRRVGLAPIRLVAKEGLALTNGTAYMTAQLSLTMHDTDRLVKIADVAAATSVEVLMGSLTAFDARIHALRPHPGQIASAENVRRLAAGSPMVASHKNCGRVQDAYSLRCTAQVHGACRDAITYVRQVVERELNSVTDNPLIFPADNEACSGGNFHGEPLSIAADVLAIALSEIASISERRIAKMMDPSTSEGLPVFLIPKEHAGVSSGYMMMQYTAAAIVSENKVHAHPASVDSIPTSANQEDHVSMGNTAARKARVVFDNVERVVAIELMCGAQAADLYAPLQLARGTHAAYEQIRQVVAPLVEDKILYAEMETVIGLIRSPEFLQNVEKAVGVLA